MRAQISKNWRERNRAKGHGCNVAIGFAEENIQKLKGCIRYLEKQR